VADPITFTQSVESRWGTLTIPRAYAALDEPNIHKRGWQAAYEAGFKEAVQRAEEAASGNGEHHLQTAPLALPPRLTDGRRTLGTALVAGTAGAVAGYVTARLTRKKKKKKARAVMV